MCYYYINFNFITGEEQKQQHNEMNACSTQAER